MTQNSKNKTYDLEERTFQFAKEVRLFIKTLEKTIENIEEVCVQCQAGQHKKCLKK